MTAQTVVSIAVAVIAAVVAITVPRWTFKRTTEHDRLKWLRDKKAELYVDMLTEGYAEHQWFLEQNRKAEMSIVKAQYPDRDRPSHLDVFPPTPDVRMQPMERAQLEARMQLFANDEVARAFTRLGGGMNWVTLGPPQSQGELQAARMEAGRSWSDFQKLVRKDLGSDKL